MQMAGQTSVVVSSGTRGKSRAAQQQAVHKLYRGNPDGFHSYLVFDDGFPLFGEVYDQHTETC